MSYEVKPVELFIRVPRQKREGKPMAKTTKKVAKKEPTPPPTDNSYSPAAIALGIGLAIVALLGLWQGKEEIDNYIRTHYTQKLVDDATTPAGEEVIATTPPAEEIKVVEPEARPDELTQILELRRLYLRAERQDGKIELRTGGNASWRHHNPTRLIHGDYTRMMGAIGSDGKYAVFPSYEKGRKAAEAYLFTDAYEYNTKTIEEAFKDYALDDLTRDTGVARDIRLKDLTPVQRSKLLDAIQKKEGWIEGKITVFENEADWEAKGW
jgi:hypothetical protein